MHAGNGDFFYQLAHEHLVFAMLDFFYEEPLASVGGHLRKVTSNFVLAMELGHKTDPDTALRLFLCSIVANEESSAHFIASAPKPNWGFSTEIDASPSSFQTRSAFVIFKGQTRMASMFLEVLFGLLFEVFLHKNFLYRKVEMQNCYHLLNSIHIDDAVNFNIHLKERMAILQKSFQESEASRNNPLNVMDLSGLGLCKLAMDRGISVGIDHVYLPLQLLDIAKRMSPAQRS